MACQSGSSGQICSAFSSRRRFFRVSLERIASMAAAGVARELFSRRLSFGAGGRMLVEQLTASGKPHQNLRERRGNGFDRSASICTVSTCAA
jgi:hypothetical protein